MKRRGKRILFRIVFGIIALFAMYLLLFPKSASEAVMTGLGLCFETVIPAVFPYLVLSGVFVGLGYAERLGRYFTHVCRRLFALPGCCAAVILMGIFCGFPVGGRMAAMLLERGSITQSQAARLVAFCDFCGPSYIVAVLGARVLGSTKAGIVICGVQTLLALLTGVFLGRGKAVTGVHGNIDPPRPDFRAVGEAFTKAALSTLEICGYVTFFSVLMSALSRLLCRLPASVNALLYGFFEMSGGIMQVKNTGAPLIFGTAMVLWSGVSVGMQIASAVTTKDGQHIGMGLYLLVRAIVVPLGCLMVYLLSLLFDFM